MSHYYFLFFHNGSESDINYTGTHMRNTIRITFYTMLMIALHTMESGAGISRVLRDLQQTHIHTGVL